LWESGATSCHCLLLFGTVAGEVRVSREVGFQQKAGRWLYPAAGILHIVLPCCPDPVCYLLFPLFSSEEVKRRLLEKKALTGPVACEGEDEFVRIYKDKEFTLAELLDPLFTVLGVTLFLHQDMVLGDFYNGFGEVLLLGTVWRTPIDAPNAANPISVIATILSCSSYSGTHVGSSVPRSRVGLSSHPFRISGRFFEDHFGKLFAVPPTLLISMPWLKTPHHRLLSIFRVQRLQHCCSSNHEHHLLSLLHRYPHLRHSLQLHSHLVTSGIHRHRISRSGILLWNTLIHRYSFGSSPLKALKIFQHMLAFCADDLPTDSFTFSFLIKACAAASLVSPSGFQLHSLVAKNGFTFHVYVHTALLNMYSCWGLTVNAQKVFDEMPEKNLVSWNAMITGLSKWGKMEMAKALFEQMPDRNVISWTGLIDGYTRVKKPEEAVSFFRVMGAQGISPSEITVLAIIPAIANLGALDIGKTLHGYCVKVGIDLLDIRVQNSLIDMYAKCGSIENSVQVFEEMGERSNLVSWTSIISGFAMHGMAEKAVRFFEKMVREKIRPNRVTFLSLLNACSHGGLIEEGVRLFTLMVNEHGVEPELKHYSCLIDMLGRSGKVQEAEEIIAGLQVEVNSIVWRTLLGCCSKHGEVEMAERVVRRIMALEIGCGGDYVVFSNMLTEAGRFMDAETIRRLLDDRNAVKIPGYSLI
ncbi:pentatricopeptide repeat-containing protein At1g09220, mitochondrial-like, partial [Phalaenopsis equestris]|uniref:pentatricopeptide repeat-containing protein At1g09220, mitochondrial-like n=1 Tax=Phalaenopsis equestris TaxID=78828 RepID=UPI0009E21A94